MQNSKYLVANDRDILWGLTVSTVGHDEVAPGEEYPTRGHADGYYFDPSRGRILNEYQMLYLVEGSGVFASAHVAERRIKAGDIFLLFPGEWHTYHPEPGASWKSYWIGYLGRNMDDRVKAGFLSPEKPVYHVGYSGEIISIYESAMTVAKTEAASMQQTLAGMVNLLVGLMYSLERNITLGRQAENVQMVKQAQQRIRETLESNLTMQELAAEMGSSYSNFRKLFKEHTGMSPAMYQQDLKLQRAKELLTTTDLSVKEIAFRLNFESADYFSSKFKCKTGQQPSAFRDSMR